MARNTVEDVKADVADAPEISEEEAAKKAAQEDARVAKAEAKTRIREFIKLTDDEALKADLSLIVGLGTRKGRTPGKTINTVLKEALIAAGDEGLTEMDIFMKFKIGQPEMVSKTRIFLRTDNPEDRIWVALDHSEDADNGTYTIVATGADAPEDWKGYVPVDTTEL